MLYRKGGGAQTEQTLASASGATSQDYSRVSDGKGSENSATGQENGEKNTRQSLNGGEGVRGDASQNETTSADGRRLSLVGDREERKALRESEESRKLFEATKQKFGTTNDINEAGYILPDGTMLDFSGRHWMDEGQDTSHLAGSRAVDHREIYEVGYDKDENETGFKTDMSDFINRGAIRVHRSGNYSRINLSMEPTAEQKKVLRRFAAGVDNVDVDFGDGNRTDHFAEYEDAWPSRVLGDIDRYFTEGIIPSGSRRYSLGDTRESFRERQKRAVKERGVVEPGLNEASVRVVDVPRHPYTGSIADATYQAIKAAKEKYVPNGNPRTLLYSNYGKQFEYKISGQAITICLSSEHQKESSDKGGHLALATQLDRVIGESIEVEEHPDRIKTEKGRDNSRINPDALMHRFYGVAKIGKTVYRVMTLLREDWRQGEGNGIHSYEAIEIEVLDEQTPNTSNGVDTPNSELEAYPVANLIKDVGKTMEPDKLLLDYSAKTTENGRKYSLSGGAQTHTENFKLWFGDWENDPENASKVVDENGRPKVVLHGTPNKDFFAFDPDKAGSGTDAGWLGRGFYFFGNAPEYASQYAGKNGRVLQVYLDIKNPYYASVEEFNRLAEANDPELSKQFREQLEEEGYDGVYYNGDLNEEWVAFRPEQIKSATENNGDFSRENPDIRYSLNKLRSGKDVAADVSADVELDSDATELQRLAADAVRRESESQTGEKTTSSERSGAISGNSSSGSLLSKGSGHLSHNALAPQKDAAKIQKNTEITLRAAKKIQNQGGLKGETETEEQAVRAIGKELHLEKSASSQSYYGDFYEGDFVMNDGSVVHVRVSDHPATNFRMGNANADHKVSVVIRKNGEHKDFGPHNGYTEITYEPSEISPAEAANAVVAGIESLIKTGEYKDVTGKAHSQDYPYVDENGVRHYSLNGGARRWWGEREEALRSEYDALAEQARPLRRARQEGTAYSPNELAAIDRQMRALRGKIDLVNKVNDLLDNAAARPFWGRAAYLLSVNCNLYSIIYNLRFAICCWLATNCEVLG